MLIKLFRGSRFMESCYSRFPYENEGKELFFLGGVGGGQATDWGGLRGKQQI